MKVCVITGGGSGMGLAAARAMPDDRIFLLSGRTRKKLDKAAEQLKTEGRQVFIKTCDTSDRKQVHALARYAASLGDVTNVIHAAGLSPSMADPEALLRVNALGTVYVNKEFAKVIARKNGIHIKWRLKIRGQLPFRPADSCSIVGNLLENAINAVKDLHEEKRWIEIVLEMRSDQMMALLVRNPHENEIIYDKKSLSASFL